MSLSLITAPAAGTPLVSLEEVKIHVEQDPSQGPRQDAYLLRLVAAATQFCEEFTGRQFVPATWELWLDRFPCGEILVPRPPCLSIVSVKYRDAQDVEQTLDAATQYETSIPAGPFAMPACILPRYGKAWPTTYSRLDAVKIQFRAGYEAGAPAVPAPPEAVKQAALLLVGEMYERREDAIVGTITTPALLGAERLLWPFRVFDVEVGP